MTDYSYCNGCWHLRRCVMVEIASCVRRPLCAACLQYGPPVAPPTQVRPR